MEYEIIGPAPTSVRLQPFGQVLDGILIQAKYVSLAVAYLHYGAIDVVGRHLSQVLQRDGQVDVLVGIRNSSGRALRSLAAIIGASNLSLYWQRGQGNFHPKLYLLANDTNLDMAAQLDVFVGSSNLTGAGLKHNLEINVHFKLTRPTDSHEITEWKNRWTRIRSLPSIRPYSDQLISNLERRGAFRQSQAEANLDDLFPVSPTTTTIDITSTTYVQTLQPNDFPNSGESDAIVPRAAREANEAFWGWPGLFRRSPGGHKQRLFANTSLRYRSREVATSCRLYEVESVANFRLSCSAVRALLPTRHDNYLFTMQIDGNSCAIRFLSPNDPDYSDYYASTRPLTNSPKRWGYI
jgi:HKD family nuclease